MHFFMHKLMETLYRCTKVDELQFTPLELTAVLRHWCRHRVCTGTDTLVCWHRTRRSGLR